jgi:group I intron endonuclease
MREFLVYWYRLSSHTNPHSEGYVGVTTQNNIRRRCHLHGRSGGSKILSQAFKKYGEENILQDVLHTVDTKEEAYELEMAYRPRPCIGWNLAVGGGFPPDTTGRKDSLETRMKRSVSVKKAKAGKSFPSIFKGTTNRYSDEQRAHIGTFHRGKTISESHKQAITEKNSGANNANAREVFLTHKDTPEKVYCFPSIKDASTSLGIPYQALRSQMQRTLKYDKTSEPSRSGWVCLSKQDSTNPVDAVKLVLAQRSARFARIAADRESKKQPQGTGVATSINR